MCFNYFKSILETVYFVKGPVEAIAKEEANLGRATPLEKCMHHNSQQPFQGMARSFCNEMFGTDLLSVQI